jgi:5-methylcytosine-specific restriction endonuclease McrA
MSITDSQRQQIRDRAGDCCEYCRLPSSGSRLPFHVDHVRPRKHNGTDIAENLCLACYQCNGYKGTNIAGYDPQNDQITPLFNPRT